MIMLNATRRTMVGGSSINNLSSFVRQRLMLSKQQQPSNTIVVRCNATTTYRQDRQNVLTSIGTDENIRSHMSYALAFAALDEYNPFPPLTRTLYKHEREQLQNSHNQLVRRRNTMTTTTSHLGNNNHNNNKNIPSRMITDDVPLPRTLEDALRPSSRAIVITETQVPFKVVNVNKAWEQLCGYTYVESHGKSLGSLLRGPETCPQTVTSLIHQLLRGESATAIITNYKKDGQKFRNRLRVGPLVVDGGSDDDSTTNTRQGHDYNTSSQPTHYVGILEEVAA